MTVSLSSSVGISLRTNPTIINFYPTQVSAYIDLYINDATLWILGATTNLVLTPAGTTYASSATIPLNAVVGASGAPSITVLTDVINKKSATFKMTCSEEGRLIYHLSRYFAYNTTACSMTEDNIQNWSEQSSIDGLRVT